MGLFFRLGILGLIGLLAILPCNPASGQTPKAVVAFEVQLKKLWESRLMDVLPVRDDMNRNVDKQMQPLLEASSIKGILGVPKSMEQARENASKGEFPVPVYIRFSFDDAQSVAKMKDGFAERSKVTEKDGYTEMRPENGSNIYLAFGDRWLVFASDDYPVHERSLENVTDAIKRSKSDRESVVQLVADVASARKFLNEGGNEIRRSQPELAFLVPIVDQLDLLSVQGDPDADKMLILRSSSRNAEMAEQFQTTIAGLVSMAKWQIESIEQRDPISDMAFEVLEGMVPKRDAKTVEVVVNRPDGLNEKLKEALGKARGAADRMRKMNSIKQVLLAMHNYASVYQRMPFHTINGENPDLSWRVRLLPYLDEMEMFDMFDRETGWDSPANKKLLELQPEAFGTNESMVCWIESSATDFRDITDGTSNTIAMILVPKQMNWTEPKDINAKEALAILKALPEGEVLLAGFYDGSVRQFAADTDPDEFQKMLTINGGEVIQR